ncbi:hypothetical protein ES703_86730 [subsurface metagenome]
MASGLIPVRGGGIKGGLAVGIVFLNRSFEGFLEGYVIRDVPAVHGDVAAVVHTDCLIVVAVSKQRRVAPGIAEVVFGARTDSRGKFLTIDEEFLIAFAPPSASWVPHVEHHATEPASALRLEHCPVDAMR